MPPKYWAKAFVPLKIWIRRKQQKLKIFPEPQIPQAAKNLKLFEHEVFHGAFQNLIKQFFKSKEMAFFIHFLKFQAVALNSAFN